MVKVLVDRLSDERVLLVALLCASFVTVAAGPVRSPGSGSRQLGRQNTWTARSGTGAALGGTWTGRVDPKTGAATGSWTLIDANGRPAMRGGWSAVKSAAGWSGSWRASVVGSAAEFSGTWSAAAGLGAGASFDDLFAVALQKVVGGTWRAGTSSGSWSIRVFASD
jgi:hypothetical protein